MRLLGVVLLSVVVMNHYASAQSLPANPWAVGAVETYSAPQAQTPQRTLPNTQQTAASINENLNVLKEYFSNSINQPQTQQTPVAHAQPTTSTSPQNNDALMQFLQNIVGANNSASQTHTAPRAQSSIAIPNPVADAQAAYNQYMNDLRRKIDDTKHKAQNYYNDAVNSAKNIMDTTRKNLHR